ncbi:class I SAM-dependent methyltransferase [Kurthia gibsonii]|uniref:class I SAM-dependent methyltransferase n=1 Tax=Kurthia gibsonii TaxID=33946 RepID=UPI0034CE1A42
MDSIKQHYQNLFEKYGDSFKSAQWSDQSTQYKRFEVLCEIADLKNKRILDFGCGTGELANYFKQKDIHVEYTGVDIVENMLEFASKKHPKHRFTTLDKIENEVFDYILISGVFNNKTKRNKEFYEEIIKKLSGMCSKGLAFNMLSKYVDYYDEHLFYVYPEDVLSYVKQITPFVTLRNEYQLKENVVPFEFTTYLYFKD